MTRAPLPRSFYNRSPEIVARDLLGKVVAHHYRGEWLEGRVIEVEAYLGLNDPASHAAVGKTTRNAVLFGPPGFAYVYLIYGLHACLNVSCLPEGEPGGVLFRALAPLRGRDIMARLRGLKEDAAPDRLTGGPGRLCQALGITRKESNGIDVTLPTSPLQLLDDGQPVPAMEVTPRIGISKAADQMLRFVAITK